jgi:acetolactate synthase-1/2/3 large subunit
VSRNTVAEQLVRYLERRGVRHIFGLCGHTNIAVLSALEGSSIRFVNVRHEQVAAHAADGYARVSGKASVLLTHLGPGLTNAATGVANAALDCIPMVVIAGDVPSHYFGKHPHQEVNLHADGSQFEIFRPFVKRAWRADRADLFPEIRRQSFRRSPRLASRSSTPVAACCSRGRARSCANSPSTWGSPSPTA